MSVTLEQVEQLRAHAAVSYEEARRALEACDGDLLDALILLEREGRIPPGGGRGAFFTTQPGAARSRRPPGPPGGRRRPGRTRRRFWGLAVTAGGHRGREERGSWRARLRELLAAAVDLLRHCTVNQFEVWRNGERMTALPVLILILLVLVAYWISLPLLVVGLFFGCKYRFFRPGSGQKPGGRGGQPGVRQGGGRGGPGTGRIQAGIRQIQGEKRQVRSERDGRENPVGGGRGEAGPHGGAGAPIRGVRGGEGLRRARRAGPGLSGEFDLVLLAHHACPPVSGMEVLRRLRRGTPPPWRS